MKKADQDITLRDVVKHIQAVRSDMQDMERRLSKKIDANTEEIKTTKKELGERIDALDEDLTATDMSGCQLHQNN